MPYIDVSTVNICKYWDTLIIAVILLKFEQGGFSILQCVLKMQKEWQTV